MSGPVKLETGPVPDLRAWTIAVIGLGTMGAGMARRVADAGAALRVFNRTPGRAGDLLARPGVIQAGTPAQAAQGADLVLVSVTDDAALQDMLVGARGVFASGPAVVVNATTVAPETVRGLAACGPLVDAGVLGNGEHARSGLLRWYVGGQQNLVAQAEPVLTALGRQVLHVGGPGSGMVLKLAMNLLMGIEMQALAEVTELGVCGGLDRQVVLDAVADSGFAAPVMKFKAKRMAGHEYSTPDFRLRLMAKDLALAVTQADSGGLTLPMTVSAAGMHDAAVSSGFGDEDCAAIARMFGRQGGDRR